MPRLPILLPLCALVALAACEPTPPPIAPLGADGLPVQRVYRIAASDTERVQARAMESLNTLRAQGRLAPVVMNAQLVSAASAHSRDMSFQGRAWAFGSDGSSPIERVMRTGYRGQYLGKAVSETYESELETINGWMASPDTRAVLMDPRARELGLAWYQEPDGKLWWTLIMGAPGGDPFFGG
jgi:uncharacterized protein YkwD